MEIVKKNYLDRLYLKMNNNYQNDNIDSGIVIIVKNHRIPCTYEFYIG